MKALSPSTILIVAISFLLCSCIEFEKQELVYSHDTEKDELRVSLKYQGIFGNLEKGQSTQNNSNDIAAKNILNQKQITQLESVLNEKRAFFFNNWIFEYSPKSLPDMMKNLMSDDKNGRYGKPEQELIDALIKNVEVQNIGLYNDNKGQLCGAQTLRIQKLSKLFTLANQVIQRQTIAHIPQLREELAKGIGQNPPSEEAIQFLEKKMKEPYSFLKITGNLLTFQFPNIYSDSQSVTKNISDELPKGARASLEDRNVIIQTGSINGMSGKLEKKCFDGYLPNAKNYLKENHKKVFLKSKQVDKKLKNFLMGRR